MSTGADCVFYEKNLDEWFYKIQRWPYGENPAFDTFGPFKTMKIAENHLDRNHANPGGWSVHTHPKHVCDFKLVEDDRYGPRKQMMEICQKCDLAKR